MRGRDAVLSVFDRGARDGEGIFETLRSSAAAPSTGGGISNGWCWRAAELGFPVPPSPGHAGRGGARGARRERL